MISFIAAIDERMGIGKDNSLLCHIKEDLQYFKKITDGNIVVMGYNTYLSLPKRPLSNRINIVMTTKNIELEGVIVVHSIDELFEKINEVNLDNKEVFICGGASIYKQLMPYADRLYITHIFHSFDADTFFPNIDADIWDKKQMIRGHEIGEYKYGFAIYEKREG
jgi:dihydrofolate reductase